MLGEVESASSLPGRRPSLCIGVASASWPGRAPPGGMPAASPRHAALLGGVAGRGIGNPCVGHLAAAWGHAAGPRRQLPAGRCAHAGHQGSQTEGLCPAGVCLCLPSTPRRLPAPLLASSPLWFSAEAWVRPWLAGGERLSPSQGYHKLRKRPPRLLDDSHCCVC